MIHSVKVESEDSCDLFQSWVDNGLQPSMILASNVTCGIKLTVTIDETELLEHPFKVYTAEYVDVSVGETSIEKLVSFVGDQITEPPGILGVAVNVVVSPIQIDELFTVIVGTVLTVTVLVEGKLEHPLTVYVRR